MTRRTLLHTSAAMGVLAQVNQAQTITPGGRLKQSVSRWCYQKVDLDTLCREAVRIGLKGIDLVTPAEWPVIRKYGLVPSMTAHGAGTIPDAWNRLDSHPRLQEEMTESLGLAAGAGVPNVITFSGNRKGMPDAEGLENCAAGLNAVKKLADERGVTIHVELLTVK